MMDNSNIGRIGSMDAAARVGKTPPHKASSEEVQAPPIEDRVEISKEGEYVSSLMSDVSRMSSTRQEVVEEFKVKVRGGNWPPPALVDGLVRLIGHNLQVEESEPKAE
jgi:hypothetical protein